MRFVRCFPLVICGFVALVCAVPASAAEYVVAVEDGVRAGAVARAEADRGNDVEAVYRAVGAVVLDLDAADVQRLRTDDRIAAIEPNRTLRIAGTRTGTGWNLARIDQAAIVDDGNYDFDRTGIGVTAYVVDTGLTGAHQEFIGRVGAGFSSVPDGRGTADCHGHGTHVAGILGGDTYGVAPDVTLVPVRVLDCGGAGTVQSVVAGLDWIIADHGAGPAVANLSLGGGPSRVLDKAVADAVDDGVTVVVAAGNERADACGGSPARERSAITVGASERVGAGVDGPAGYSNLGTCVDLFAPGSAVESAWDTGKQATKSLSGTSMAAPHVAGVAALALEREPAALPTAVAATISRLAVRDALVGVSATTPNLLLQSRELPRPAAAVPTAPRRLAGIAADGAVRLSWRPPAESAGSPVSRYDVEVVADALTRTLEIVGTTATTVADLERGVPAELRVRAVNDAGPGPWTDTISVTPAAPPSNDAQAAPLEVDWGAGFVVDSSLAATAEPGEAPHGGTDSGATATASLWYRITPPEAGIMRLTTSGSAFDTVLSVYGATGRSLVESDDTALARGDVTSAVEVAVVPDATYLVAVDGWSGARGALRLSWSMRQPVVVVQSLRVDAPDPPAIELAVPARPRITRASIVRGRAVRLRITPVPGAQYEVFRNGRLALVTRSARPLVRLARGPRSVFRVRVVTPDGTSRLSAAVVVRRPAVKGL